MTAAVDCEMRGVLWYRKLKYTARARARGLEVVAWMPVVAYIYGEGGGFVAEFAFVWPKSRTRERSAIFTEMGWRWVSQSRKRLVQRRGVLHSCSPTVSLCS